MLQQQKGSFLLLSDAYSLRSYLYRKEVNAFMFTIIFYYMASIWQGGWGAFPQQVYLQPRMSDSE
ncbi:hypothetical protein, partial [Staphylococcus sp. MB377]|jgi:hypothetical protein|uniref:hypothetical protein n=1 Tax=Staphylococcus sp. MB377 TaxID=1663564 RepID=UPI00096495DA